MWEAVTANREDVQANTQDYAQVAEGDPQIPQQPTRYSGRTNQQHSTQQRGDHNPASGAAAHRKSVNTRSGGVFSTVSCCPAFKPEPASARCLRADPREYPLSHLSTRLDWFPAGATARRAWP